LRFSLLRIAEKSGAKELKTYLAEQASDRQAAEKNSWQAAMYDGLAKSRWFRVAGYKLIV
jgi:hypothetical protein